MFMNRAHHRLPRPVGLPPRSRRASEAPFDDEKLDAVAPPAGVMVEFLAIAPFVATPASVATLALTLARPRACICATPRSQRDARPACRSRPRSARASVTVTGEPKPPGVI